MKISCLHIENYRNISSAQLDLHAQSIFLCGDNGQGKTNAIEAISLLHALRSFRTSELQHCIQYEAPYARLYYELSHEQLGDTEVLLTLQNKQKSLTIDGNRVNRTGDILGQFPSVILCSEDIQLIRGSPSLRRRYIDLLIASLNKDYLKALQCYHRSQKERNALLKSACEDATHMQPFEKIMAEAAGAIVKFRRDYLVVLNEQLTICYQTIAPDKELPSLRYMPCVEHESQEQWLALYEKNRRYDMLRKHTQLGPHRDDYEFQFNQNNAREYASEGQQRSLVLAIKLANIVMLTAHRKIAPIILADDILGELDVHRREGFWKTIGPELQIIATGTQPPMRVAGRNWSMLNVGNGAFGVGE